MSLLWLLRKFVDPIEQRHEEEDRRRKREVRPAEGDDRFVDEPPLVAVKPRMRATCRVCGHQGSVGDYCPTCLADTMVPARR